MVPGPSYYTRCSNHFNCPCDATYIPHLYVENQVKSGSLWYFQALCHMAFAENVSFNSSGIIYWLLLPSSLPPIYMYLSRTTDNTDWFITDHSILTDKLLGFLCMLTADTALLYGTLLGSDGKLRIIRIWETSLATSLYEVKQSQMSSN